jgi:hypothetical protein
MKTTSKLSKMKMGYLHATQAFQLEEQLSKKRLKRECSQHIHERSLNPNVSISAEKTCGGSLATRASER